MRFRIPAIFTTLLFSAFIIIFATTSCERNLCDNVTCFNGGSCNMGMCRCKVGFEDPQCQTKAVQRYIGRYGGLSTCDMGGYLNDSVLIYADDANVNHVFVALKSIHPKVLHGYTDNSESTYKIIIPDDVFPKYQKVYTLTLQGDVNLVLNTYLHDFTNPLDTVISKCQFVGVKVM